MTEEEAAVLHEHSQYRPLFQLGRGGMARVYLAETTATSLRRLVVLKVLNPQLANHPEMRTAFRREAELCARLNHPNIVQVFEAFERGGHSAIVMEYVDGATLLAANKQRMPLRFQVHVLMQVLAALHYFHGVHSLEGEKLAPVHRDVSPQNVLVMHEGVVKVLDFGIAKVNGRPEEEATREGIMKGTIRYMAPEQIAGGKNVDRRADLFGVGVMLWEAVAGRRMWGELSEHEVLLALVKGEIPPLNRVPAGTPAPLLEAIERATSASPLRRYETALDMQLALEPCLDALGGPVRQREVADFMSRAFGKQRADRQRAIAEAARDRSTSDLWETDAASGIQTLSASTSNRVVTLVKPPSARYRVFAAILVVAVAAIVVAVRWGGARGAAEPAAGEGARVVPPPLRAPSVVSAALDEVPSPSEPAARTSPLPTTAETPTAPPPSLPPARGHGEGASKGAHAPSPRRAVTVPSQPRASLSVSASPPAKDGCSPPYTLSPDGVKTYKPECF